MMKMLYLCLWMLECATNYRTNLFTNPIIPRDSSYSGINEHYILPSNSEKKITALSATVSCKTRDEVYSPDHQPPTAALYQRTPPRREMAEFHNVKLENQNIRSRGHGH